MNPFVLRTASTNVSTQCDQRKISEKKNYMNDLIKIRSKVAQAQVGFHTPRMENVK